jgi:acyl-CoA synthetase (AMP-forming)/AMP-acid ligase II
MSLEEWNFAARLIGRLGDNSHLIDAPSGRVIPAPEVPSRIATLAAAFRSAGLRTGDRLLVGCGLTPASTLAYLGALYAGLVAVPVNDRGLSDTGGAIVGKTGACAVWTDSGRSCEWADRAGVRHLAGRFDHNGSLDFDRTFGTRHADLEPPVRREERDLAVLMPTSGSTGTPRFVKVSHGNLLANTEAIVRSQALRTDERAMLVLPVSYSFGASVMHTHLYQGGGVVFDSRFMFPDKVLRAIGEYRCTTFAGVPTAYSILLRRSGIRSIPLGTLRRFLQAGGALAPESVRQIREIVPHAEFFVMYGQTEATARIACLPVHRQSDKLGSVGLPLDNVTVRVVDDHGRDVSAGEAGEIWVSGKSVCEGYLDEPEATQRTFRDGWLRTGDIATRDPEGVLWIKGRRGDFIKVRGVRVGFSEVEAKVAAAPGVDECAAIAVPHSEAGEALALFVVPERGAARVAETVRRALPPEWTCDSVNLVDSLPKTVHGKLARARLAEMIRIA